MQIRMLNNEVKAVGKRMLSVDKKVSEVEQQVKEARTLFGSVSQRSNSD